MRLLRAVVQSEGVTALVATPPGLIDSAVPVQGSRTGHAQVTGVPVAAVRSA